jgi:hypothetical protein
MKWMRVMELPLYTKYIGGDIVFTQADRYRCNAVRHGLIAESGTGLRTLTSAADPF